MAVLGVLIAVMAGTNPTREDFVRSIGQLTTKSLGQWAGQADPQLHWYLLSVPPACSKRVVCSICERKNNCFCTDVLSSATPDNGLLLLVYLHMSFVANLQTNTFARKTCHECALQEFCGIT